MSQAPAIWNTRRGEMVRVAVSRLTGELVRLRQGSITNDEFRPTRTILAVYGQRQPEQYMVRVRLPYGVITAPQLRTLAQVTSTYGNGGGHVTTRQDIQLHWLSLDAIPEVLRQLGDAGLITLQAGGNSVRNVAACPLAGVCGSEVFDVTASAAAVDEYYVGNPEVQHLPRKFKSSFSGCPTDCAASAIQDFGAIAVQRAEGGDARQGFRVYVGGGLGSMPRPAILLEDFVPADDLLATYHAVVRLFDRLGDRTRKDRARLKFVISRLGEDEFRRLVREERDALRREGLAFPAPSPDKPLAGPADGAAGAEAPQTDDYGRWHRWNVVPQRQHGIWSVAIGLPLGDMTSEQMEAVAALAERGPGSTLRTSAQQNLYLRGVAHAALPVVYDTLHAAGLTTLRANGIADITSCPGTSACSLGITASKGLARALQRMFLEGPYQDDPALGHLRVKCSGCPDACSQHHLADLGLCGAVLHQDGHVYPAAILHLGGKVDARGTRLAQPTVKLPARQVPPALQRLLAFYKGERQTEEAFAHFIDRVGTATLRGVLKEYTRVAPVEQDPWNFIDWDATRMFLLERGEGECSL